MQVLAPAKINLFLKVLGRRPDDLHQIETLISPISLADELRIERQAGDQLQFECDDPSVPSGDDNLVVRAAKLFFQETKQKGEVSIKLAKKIPHGAGLGGGSSDAASTLLALDRLFGTHLPRQAVAEMGSAIGSDVPFFIFESAAVCRGRGELVLPEKLRKRLGLLLLKPDFGVLSGWAYSRWSDSRELPDVSYAPQTIGDLIFVNDLERPVFEKYVFLGEMKNWLREQPETAAALLSGSGSTVFVVLRDAGSANALAARAKEELDPNLWTCACETIG